MGLEMTDWGVEKIFTSVLTAKKRRRREGPRRFLLFRNCLAVEKEMTDWGVEKLTPRLLQVGQAYGLLP
jgi:hypothetical protein